MSAAGAVAAALLLVVLSATPATAHTRADNATNYDSRIEHDPRLPGVRWRLYPGGEYLQVENRSDTDLVVLGYEGEPYLAVGPEGVRHNRNSPAAYLNAERYGDVALPPRADPTAPPDWQSLASEPRHAWHDHRVHWMPGEAVAVPAGWEVPVRYGDQEHVLGGQLRYEPGPPWWPWLGAGLLLTAGAAAGLRRRGRPDRLLRPAAATVGAVAALNLVHLPDEILALPLPAMDVLFGLLHNLLFITAGVGGALISWRLRGRSLLPLVVGSAAVLFHQGLLQLPQLGASQLATVWPTEVIRVLVAVSVAQAAWVGVVVIAGLRSEAPAPAAASAVGDGTNVPLRPGPSPRTHA